MAVKTCLFQRKRTCCMVCRLLAKESKVVYSRYSCMLGTVVGKYVYPQIVTTTELSAGSSDFTLGWVISPLWKLGGLGLGKTPNY